LVAMGLETNLVVALPFRNSVRDRTYAAALGVKDWLEANAPTVRVVNLYSLGPHSRRSHLLYEKALATGRVRAVRVGVMAHPDEWYDPERWWAYTEGFKNVTSEAIAYLYARLLFHAPR
jgi:hypothetical protein